VHAPGLTRRPAVAGDKALVGRRPGLRGGWLLAAAGVLGMIAAVVADRSAAQAAASQDWPPFALVTGLLLIGLAADDDGLFAAMGALLARTARSGLILYAGAVVLISLVTAVLNLDTSVAFLTPVLVYTARSRGEGEAPLLYGCLLLSNAASLLLPGSNLTNLIVLGHRHLHGHEFLARMAPAWLAAIVVTAVVIGVAERRALRVTAEPAATPERPTFGLGLLAVLAAIATVLVLPSPAVPVLAVGVAVTGVRLARRSEHIGRVRDTLGLATLIGLFGVAVALGTLGRAWAVPTQFLNHLDSWSTAAVAALVSVLVNNLPAASLLAARVPPHPYALLVGLNLGPNLCVTGSLAWILWLRAAHAAGARPSLVAASRLGVIAVPLSLAAAVGALILAGSR
jgi:arsenical pump membrane protein